MSLSCAWKRKELHGDKKSLFLFRNTVRSFISRYEAFEFMSENPNWCFISTKLTTKEIIFYEYDGERRWMKHKNVKWNDLSLTFDIYLYNIAGNVVKTLSIHFHCNWSDHTAIEIVLRRDGGDLLLLWISFWLFHSADYMSQWLILRTSHMCQKFSFSPLGSSHTLSSFFCRSLMNIPLIKN